MRNSDFSQSCRIKVPGSKYSRRWQKRFSRIRKGSFRRYSADETSTESVKNYTIAVEGGQILYFDCAAAPSTRLSEGVNKSCQVLVNGESIRTEFPSQSENGLLELGTFENETVTITVRISKKISPAYFGVFGLDTEKLETLCEDATGRRNTGQRKSHHGFRGGTGGQTLFLPVSWDRGWSATVNGEKASVSRAGGHIYDHSFAGWGE